MSDLIECQIKEVLHADYEQTISLTPAEKGRHSVRLDVVLSDSSQYVNVEIQRLEEPDILRRIRYYQSAVTMNFCLKTGEPYSALRDSIIVFICDRPVIGNCWKYTVQDIIIGSDGCTSVARNGARSFIYNTAYMKNANVPKTLQTMFRLMREDAVDSACQSELANIVRKVTGRSSIMAEADKWERIKEAMREDMRIEVTREVRQEVQFELYEKSILSAYDQLTYPQFTVVLPGLTKEDYSSVCKKHNLKPKWG